MNEDSNLGYLLKGILLFFLMCAVGYLISIHNQKQAQYQALQTRYTALAAQKERIKKVKPDVKKITTAYQKAENDGNKLCQYENIFCDAFYNKHSKYRKAQTDNAKIMINTLTDKGLAQTNFDPHYAPLSVNPKWKSLYVYGGQDAYGNITGLFVFSQDNNVMEVWQANYDPDSRRFTPIRSFYTQRGQAYVRDFQTHGQARLD